MYDLAIIGSGAAGIACAKTAVRAKIKTVLIEKEKALFGGTCLNVGCIPAKFFLNSVKLGKSWPDCFSESKSLIERIKVSTLAFLEKQGITVAWGNAQFIDKNTLAVNGQKISAKNIIIAAGSVPRSIIQHQKIIFAQNLFNESDLGNKFLVVGAGYIGIEVASLLNSLGKEVYLIEKEESILPHFDQSLSNRLKVILQRKGIKIDTNSDLKEYNLDDFDLVISAVGCAPGAEQLNTGKIGLTRDAQGWLKTDNFMRTNIENIYACGDVTGKKLLAYIAEYQARLCLDNIGGKKLQEDYSGVPECVFSIPSAAKVGLCEQEAKEKGIKYRVLKTNFLKFSSSYVYNDTEGFIQILVDEKAQIIGAGIISNIAAELISIFSLCIKNNLGLEALQRCLFIHPTLSEIIPLLVCE